MNDAVPSIAETCQFLSDPALDGRYPGSAGHETARAYLEEMLQLLGCEPLFGDSFCQPIIRGPELLGTNLGGIRRGRSGRTILLGAHYDHFQGIPGADDNAAAVSIVIDAARQLSNEQLEHDLVVCFFDLGEPPHFCSETMGSVYFANKSPIDLKTIDCAIILDPCGHDVPVPGREDALFVLGAEESTGLLDAVGEIESETITPYFFANERVGDMSDHHAFRLRQVPFLFLSCGRWEHYHRPTDTFDRLNLEKMAGIADYLVATVSEIDARVTAWSAVPGFWQVEAESLRRLIGKSIPDNKAAVDRALGQLLAQFAV